MPLLFKAHQTIEFIGDSITDFDRTSPAFSPLGSGYVRAIHTLLQAGYPELKLDIINGDQPGAVTNHAKPRLSGGCAGPTPDWLFSYIGVNDRLAEILKETRMSCIPAPTLLTVTTALSNPPV